MDSSPPPVEPVTVIPPPVEHIDVDETITVDVDEDVLAITPPRRNKFVTSGEDVAVRQEAVRQYHKLIRDGVYPCAAADEIGKAFKCTGQTIRNWIGSLNKISAAPVAQNVSRKDARILRLYCIKPVVKRCMQLSPRLRPTRSQGTQRSDS